MPLLRPFQKEDYYAWAGACRHGTSGPLLYDADKRFVIIVAGGDTGGLPNIFIQVNEGEDCCEPYCYIECHPAENWDSLCTLAEWIAAGLQANDKNMWCMVNALIEAQS